MAGKAPSIYPERDTYESSGTARCLMFYDWPNLAGAEWLDLAEKIFAEFGQPVHEGSGNRGDQHSHGAYRRVQKRLTGFLGAPRAPETGEANIRLRGRTTVASDAFYPCDVEFVLAPAKRSGHGNEGMVAVRETLVESCDALIKRIGKTIFDATGPVYAGAFDFPTLFGPACYQASIGSIPSGMSSLVNREYTERLTQWRDRRWDGMRTDAGHLRELYPINFVLDAHLRAPFQGAPFADYMKKVGEVKATEYAGMHRWNVPGERLDWVRQDLEASGLILSSRHSPLELSRR